MIGILGGTFDPVHNGHLYIAQQALIQLPLQQIYFVPTYQPVHRHLPIATAIERLTMLQLAINNQSNLKVDEREITRRGPSYMIDTLISFRQQYPTTSLGLLLATDAFAKFDQWHRWRELLDYAHLIIVQRQDSTLEFISEELRQFIHDKKTTAIETLQQQSHGHIYFSDMMGLPISSTFIRAAIKAGQNPSGLLPPAVWDYICQKHLYQIK